MSEASTHSSADPSPGPWTYTRYDRPAGGYATARTIYTIDDADGARIAIGVRDETNARLMAAAPDLLAAATSWLRYETDEDWREEKEAEAARATGGNVSYGEALLDELRATIAKATGELP